MMILFTLIVLFSLGKSAIAGSNLSRFDINVIIQFNDTISVIVNGKIYKICHIGTENAHKASRSLLELKSNSYHYGSGTKPYDGLASNAIKHGDNYQAMLRSRRQARKQRRFRKRMRRERRKRKRWEKFKEYWERKRIQEMRNREEHRRAMRKAKRIREKWREALNHEVLMEKDRMQRQQQAMAKESHRKSSGYALLNKLIDAALEDTKNERLDILRELERVYKTDLRSIKRKELARDKAKRLLLATKDNSHIMEHKCQKFDDYELCTHVLSNKYEIHLHFDDNIAECNDDLKELLHRIC